MSKTRELQLKALDVLGKRHAEIGKQLDELATLTSPFDIEAKVYFISKLAGTLESSAIRVHTEMHAGNSPEPKIETGNNGAPNTYKLWEIVNAGGPTGRFSVSYVDNDGMAWHISDVGFESRELAHEYMKVTHPEAVEEAKVLS